MEMVELRSNARHSSNPPALPGDNQVFFVNLNILYAEVCGEETGPICGRHILRKTSKRALWKRLTGKTYLNLHLAWKNVHIWGK